MLGYLWSYCRAWDWRLFLFILLFIGLPNIYQLYRIYLIGNELPEPGQPGYRVSMAVCRAGC